MFNTFIISVPRAFHYLPDGYCTLAKDIQRKPTHEIYMKELRLPLQFTQILCS